MSYFSLDIQCSAEYVEILMAELAEIGFTTFQEKEDASGLLAFADENIEIDATSIEELMARYSKLDNISYKQAYVEKENWNEDWEKNYDPISIGNKILVRASFHPSETSHKYEIIVTPKMSFGTGHHETTYQLLEMLYDMDLEGKDILDAGCGTGILAILTHKKGASNISAYDIDEWAIENTEENFSLNGIENNSHVSIWKGDVFSIKANADFDIIIANINRNILLHDIQYLSSHLRVGGSLLLSGFYEEDIKDILEEAAQFKLREQNRSLKNNWAALSLSKEK